MIEKQIQKNIYKNPHVKILGIIPARGGSKGIPGKNIIEVAGQPLIAYTINAARRSRYLDKVVVSSDDDKILSISSQYGAQGVKRPARLAKDNSKFEDLIFHVLNYLKKKENYSPDILVYLQPTSPLRKVDDVNGAIQKLLVNKAASVISVQEIDREYLKTFVLDRKGYLTGAVNNTYPFKNRQDLPEIYLPNGAVYVVVRKEFEKRKSLFAKKTLPFVMPKERSLDINTREDLLKAENLINLQSSHLD